MKMHKQRGLSLIGFILVLSLALFVSFLGMKIGPIYMEYFSVVNAMDNIASEKGSARLSPYQIRLKFSTQMNINAVKNVGERHLRLTRGNGVHMRVTYEVREPLIGNLDVVAKFDKSVRLSN